MEEQRNSCTLNELKWEVSVLFLISFLLTYSNVHYTILKLTNNDVLDMLLLTVFVPFLLGVFGGWLISIKSNRFLHILLIPVIILFFSVWVVKIPHMFDVISMSEQEEQKLIEDMKDEMKKDDLTDYEQFLIENNREEMDYYLEKGKLMPFFGIFFTTIFVSVSSFIFSFIGAYIGHRKRRAMLNLYLLFTLFVNVFITVVVYFIPGVYDLVFPGASPVIYYIELFLFPVYLVSILLLFYRKILGFVLFCFYASMNFIFSLYHGLGFISSLGMFIAPLILLLLIRENVDEFDIEDDDKEDPEGDEDLEED